MKALIIITGIGESAYGIDCLKKTGVYPLAAEYYDCIKEIDYQPILDRRNMCFKTLGDPIKYMLSPKSHKVREFIEAETKQLLRNSDEVDLLTHSLGGWISEELHIKVHNWYSLASAVGWFLPFGRMMIDLRIQKPNIKYDYRYWVFSEKDLVASTPPFKDKNYNINTEFIKIVSPHDMEKYVTNPIFLERFLRGKK